MPRAESEALKGRLVLGRKRLPDRKPVGLGLLCHIRRALAAWEGNAGIRLAFCQHPRVAVMPRHKSVALPVGQEDDLVDAMQACPSACMAVRTLGAPVDKGANGVVLVQLAQHVIDKGRFIEMPSAGYEKAHVVGEASQEICSTCQPSRSACDQR